MQRSTEDKLRDAELSKVRHTIAKMYVAPEHLSLAFLTILLTILEGEHNVVEHHPVPDATI